jgi:PAS domain S-box-containing protein
MNKSRSKIISISAAVITMVLGILVILGWLTDSDFLKPLVPGTVTMKFNAALGFVCSSGIVLLRFFPGKNKMRYGISVILCVIVSLIGLLTLLEYCFGYNPGIDEFFVKDRLHPRAYYAGRMSPLSATNFLFIGIGLFLLNKPKTATYQFFYLAGISFISLLMMISFNFIADISTFMHLSIYAATGFITLCAAIYFAQPALQKKISFHRKMFTGFTAVIILITVLSIFSSYYNEKRTHTSQWIKRTNDLLTEAAQVLPLSLDIESASRGYIITGDSNYLEYFKILRDSIYTHDKKLKELTENNPSQQVRIDSLSALVSKRIDFSLRCIQARNEKGFIEAQKLMATLQGKFYTDAIRDITEEIQQEGNNLLIQRQKENDKSIVSFNRAYYILLASIFILLVIIFFSIRHNISVRKKAEEKVKASEQMFSTLFYKSPLFKAIIERPTGKYIEVNDAFVDFVGNAKEDILGKTSMELNILEHPENWDQVIKNIQKNGSVREQEMQLNSKNGNTSWVSTNVDIVNLNGKECFLSTAIDITKRKIAEENLLTLSQELEEIVLERTEELNRSEKSYRYLFENNPMPMWVIDLNTFKFLDVNEMAILQYGYSREEFLSMTTLDIRPDEGKTLFKQSDHLAEMNKTNYSKGIWNHRKKDGTIILAETIGHKIIFEGVNARLILSNDVTEKKKAEEKLDKSEKLFRAMIEKDTDMKTLATPNGKNFYASPSITKILGYENQEFMATPVFDLIHPDDVAGLIRSVTAVVQSPGKSFSRQQRLKHKNGTWLWCEGTITNMLHEPAVAALVSNFRDITERKQVEEAIKLAEANYREIFDKASDGIYVLEIETGKVIEVNQKACNITGYSREELFNSDQLGFITDNSDYTLQHAMDYLQKAAAGEPQLFEWIVKNKDGSINWLEVNLKKATIAGKERLLAFFREINDRRKARLEIRKLNEELEQKVIDRTEQLDSANKELEAFSYSVSHDLRAPLRAINGFAKILGENYSTVFDDEGQRLFNRIKVNAKKMGSLIDDLLEFSRLGRKEIHKSPIRMTELAQAALVEINTTVDHNAAVEIHQLHPAQADSPMINQVMINLLTNAIKYSSKTEKPSVVIKSHREENEIIYSVSDNGVGFNNQFAHKLFGVFQRLHLQADFEGTGVGLALVKRIINKHGGRVWAKGELNKGATFYFSLPVTKKINS